MTIKERKERERIQRCQMILDAAGEILREEGIERISIRKIADRIDYSPAIIYHYFKDKDEIISQLVGDRYRKILTALSPAPSANMDPVSRLKEASRKYIEAALEMPDEFLAVQLSKSPKVLNYISNLYKGAAANNPATGILFRLLKEIYGAQSLDDSQLELSAQIISSASVGLAIKLIVERDRVSAEQKERLISYFVSSIVDGMVLRNSLD